MQTNLSLFCNRVTEAGWLAAAIVTPLFFNIFTEITFEVGKVTLLRSIALVMTAVWLIRVVETEPKVQDGEKGGLASITRHLVSRNPLAIPALIFAAVYIFTTITSVIPRVSLWGSYQRWQGTYTTLSYIAIFLITSYVLRTREQLDRLITVIILVSLPISLYGFMQHYRLDPVPWAGEVAWRVISTLGNPIFVAAYLIMVVPLTLGRLVRSFSSLLANKERGIFSSTLAGCYLLLLALQLICIVFTQSRGPFIGLMAGLFFFFLLLAVSKGKKGLALMTVSVAIELLLLFAILNLSNSPLAPIKEMPYIGRLGRIFEMESGTGQTRLLTWKGVGDLITADPVRMIIGHGPESMYVAFNRYFPTGLAEYAARGVTFDHSHNETLDVLATMGLIGFIAYLLLFSSIFYHSLRWLGFIKYLSQRAAFGLLWIAGVLFGAVTPWLLEGNFRFFGLGLPAGMMVALAVYLIVYILFWYNAQEKTTSDKYQILLISLISAIVAHFVEIQFGIAFTTTRAYFWLYMALIIAIVNLIRKEPGLPRVAPTATALNEHHPRQREGWKRRVRVPGQTLVNALIPWNNPIVSYSLLIGLVFMTLGFDFIANPANFKPNNLSVPWLLFLVWLFGGLIIAGEIRKSGNNIEGGGPSDDSFLTYSLIPFGSLFTFIMLTSSSLGRDPANAIIVYCFCLFVNILVIAASLTKGVSPYIRSWRGANWWLYPVLILGAFAMIFTTNLNFLRADICCKQGLAYGDAGQWDVSIALFRQGLQWAPHQDRYCIFLAGAYVAKAEATSDREARSDLFDEARKALERARRINPLDPDHVANSGRFYQKQVETETDLAKRIEGLEKALGYYQQAVVMSPNNHGRRLKGDIIRAHLLLGDAYMAVGRSNQAGTAYGRAIELDPQMALQERLSVIKGCSDDYACHRNLAIFYQQLGRVDEALAEMKKARNLAPPSEKASLNSFLAQQEAQNQ